MITFFHNHRKTFLYRIFSGFIAFSFLFSLVLPPGYAQSVPGTFLNLPAPGTMVSLTAGFTPLLVKGITVHPENPLQFDFFVDPGNSRLEGEQLRAESTRLIKYFLASLTVPEDELWVNLSPYEKDRIISDTLGQTEMGRDMLAQDYILKQLTASLMYPEKELGQKFWDRIYQKAREQYGTTEIPVDTFNKVWIVPDKAVVYQHGNSAFVVDSWLKVMLESDYQAQNLDARSSMLDTRGESSIEHPESRIETSIIKEILIPEIEREVNEGQTFAQLRQIYNSMILAIWYKQNLRESLLGRVYIDQAKTKGVDVEDKEVNQKIYNQYLEAFKKGVYSYIKEDYDPATRETIPRKYFSGGLEFSRQQWFRLGEKGIETKQHISQLSPAQRRNTRVSSPVKFIVNLVEHTDRNQNYVARAQAQQAIVFSQRATRDERRETRKASSPLAAQRKSMQEDFLFGGNWKRSLSSEQEARDRAQDFKDRLAHRIPEGAREIFFVQDEYVGIVAGVWKGTKLEAGVQSTFFSRVVQEQDLEGLGIDAKLLRERLRDHGYLTQEFRDAGTFYGFGENWEKFKNIFKQYYTETQMKTIEKALHNALRLDNDLQGRIDRAYALGATWANVGHSMHRRMGYVLSDNDTGSMMRAILDDGRLMPWFTVEESGGQDVNGRISEQELQDGILIGLKLVSAEEAGAIPVTYEPTAKISTKGGTKEIDTTIKVGGEDAKNKVEALLKVLTQRYDSDTARLINKGYGASVAGNNAEEIYAVVGNKNALVGGQSQKADNWDPVVVNGMKGAAKQKAAAASSPVEYTSTEKVLISVYGDSIGSLLERIAEGPNDPSLYVALGDNYLELLRKVYVEKDLKKAHTMINQAINAYKEAGKKVDAVLEERGVAPDSSSKSKDMRGDAVNFNRLPIHDIEHIKNLKKEINSLLQKKSESPEKPFSLDFLLKPYFNLGNAYYVASDIGDTLDELAKAELAKGAAEAYKQAIAVYEKIKDPNFEIAYDIVYAYRFVAKYESQKLKPASSPVVLPEGRWEDWVQTNVEAGDLKVDMFRDYDYRYVDGNKDEPGRPLSPEIVFRLGLVWAGMAIKKAQAAGITNRTVLVAKDARKIEPRLEDALVAALRYRGLNVVYIAKDAPNAVTSYSWAVQQFKPLMSIFATASHLSEPEEVVIRGFKVAMLNKLGGNIQSLSTQEIKVESLKAIKEIIENPGKIRQMEAPQKGTFTAENIDENVIRFNTLIGKIAASNASLYELGEAIKKAENPLTVLEQFEERYRDVALPLKGMKIVVEGFHTPSGMLTVRTFRNLGAEVIGLNEDIQEISGKHKADPAVEANLRDLEDKIVEVGADFGMAFDLDGDRGVIDMPKRFIVSPETRFESLAPDNLITVLLSPLKIDWGYNLEEKRYGVIRDVLGTKGVNDRAKELNVEFYQTDAGYVFLKAKKEEKEREDVIFPIYGERSGHIWTHVAGEIENPLAVGVLFATLVRKEKAAFFDARIQGAGMERKAGNLNPVFDVFRDKTIPYSQSPRFQPLFHPELLTALSQDPRNTTGWRYDRNAKEQKNPPQAIIALGKDASIKMLKKEFIPGKTYVTPAGTLRVKEFNDYLDEQDGLYRFTDIVFEMEEKFVGRFVFRASANEPAFVTSYETPFLLEEKPEAVHTRRASIAGVVIDFLISQKLAIVTEDDMRTLLSLLPLEEIKNRYTKANLAFADHDYRIYKGTASSKAVEQESAANIVPDETQDLGNDEGAPPASSPVTVSKIYESESAIIKEGLLAGIPKAIESLWDQDLRGVRVMVRANLNVPVNDKGEIEDTTRIVELFPLLDFLKKKEAIVILLGHKGRDKDRASVRPVKNIIANRYPTVPVIFYDESITDSGLHIGRESLRIPEGRPGSFHILENVRFALDYEQGEKGSPKREDFGRRLAEMADIFIFEAAGDLASEGASVEDLPRHFVDKGGEVFVGPATVRETEMLDPVVQEGIDAIVFGGNKKDKVKPLLDIFQNLFAKLRFVILGSSSSDAIAKGDELLTKLYEANSDRIFKALDYDSPATAFDIGDKTIALYLQKLDTLRAGQTVLVNGTMGWIEKGYTKGTEKIINKLKELAQRGVRIVVIGGDGSRSARDYGLDQQPNVYMFTGGGVQLKRLAGKKLTGVIALQEAHDPSISAKKRKTGLLRLIMKKKRLEATRNDARLVLEVRTGLNAFRGYLLDQIKGAELKLGVPVSRGRSNKIAGLVDDLIEGRKLLAGEEVDVLSKQQEVVRIDRKLAEEMEYSLVSASSPLTEGTLKYGMGMAFDAFLKEKISPQNATTGDLKERIKSITGQDFLDVYGAVDRKWAIGILDAMEKLPDQRQKLARKFLIGILEDQIPGIQEHIEQLQEMTRSQWSSAKSREDREAALGSERVRNVDIESLRTSLAWSQNRLNELRKSSSPVVESVTSDQLPVTRISSVTNAPGGIDLNPALLDLQIKRDANFVPLPLPQQPIEHMHIEGFIPVIINITPVTNLPLLLGLADDAAPDTEQTSPPLKAREPEQVSSLN